VRWILREALLQPPTGNDNNGDATFDPSKWQHQLWNFLLRPYLVTYEQWRDIVRLYSYLSAAEAAAAAPPQEDGENGRTLDSNDATVIDYEQPERYRHLPVPTFQSIRHNWYGKVEESRPKTRHNFVAVAASGDEEEAANTPPPPPHLSRGILQNAS